MDNGYMTYDQSGVFRPPFTRIRYPGLAEAYVPYQRYMTSFPPMEALRQGTMFPELAKPYEKRSYYKEER